MFLPCYTFLRFIIEGCHFAIQHETESEARRARKGKKITWTPIMSLLSQQKEMYVRGSRWEERDSQCCQYVPFVNVDMLAPAMADVWAFRSSFVSFLFLLLIAISTGKKSSRQALLVKTSWHLRSVLFWKVWSLYECKHFTSEAQHHTERFPSPHL